MVSTSRILRSLLLTGLSLSGSWLICGQPVQAESELQSPPPKERYYEAIRDAAVVDPSEVVPELIPLVPDNDRLVWHADRQRVLVVTWKSQSSFDRFIKPFTNSSTNEKQLIWVTAAPQVQQFCRQYRQQQPNATAADLKLRLQQYLGLDPDWTYDVFVELWVDVRDLARPCADPEVSDRQCQVEFPAPWREDNATTPWSASQPQVAGITPRSGIVHYPSFFRELYYHSIRTNRQPFTGLGYTYDWGNPQREVGASEFILLPGATYAIERVVSTAAYCEP